MRYFLISGKSNGDLDIDYQNLSDITQVIQISNTQFIIATKDSVVPRPSWAPATQTDWNNHYVPPTPIENTNELAQLKSDVQTMQETINFLLGL